MPWRATWSSMCSRNGSPVESFAAPLPSRSTRTRIWVSLVLRVTSAVLTMEFLSSQRLTQRVEQYTVFVRRADGYAQAIAHRRHVQILHQDALAPQALECAVRVGHANEEEVRLRGKNSHAWQRRQRLSERAAVGANARGLLLQNIQMLQKKERGSLREHVRFIGGAPLVELLDPLRPPGQIAEANAREAELGDRAQHDEVGELGQAPHEALAREGVVGLVQHDQPRRSADDLDDVFFRIEHTGRIVRIGNEYDRRLLLLHASQECARIERNIVAHRYRHRLHA